jgi:flagellar biogenesis protein FliO
MNDREYRSCRPSFLIPSIIPIAIVAMSCSMARGDDKPRIPAPSRSKAVGSTSESTGGWWFGSVGIAAALAVFGGVSLASKRFLPHRESGPMQVIGRSSLSPKHAVTLLRVGHRVLIVGTGPQGPPATLGEITDPAELARLIPQRTSGSGSVPVPSTRPSFSMAPSTGFDRRIGDDE